MLFLSLCFGLAFPLSAYAVTGEESDPDAYLSSLDDLLGDRFAVDVNDPDAVSEYVGIRGALAEMISAVRGSGSEVVSFFCFLLGLCILMATAESLSHRPSVSRVVGYALNCVFSVALFERVYGMMDAVATSLADASDLFSALIPLMSAITVAGGGTSTASAQAVTMSVTLGLSDLVCTSVLLPTVSVIFALGLVGSIGEGSGMRALSDTLRRFFLWTLGIVTAVIGASLSLQTVICASADSAGMRAAKYAASGMIPIVGSTVSGALSTLASGLLYVKSTVGACGVAALLALVLPSLVRLLLYRAAMDICISFLNFCAPGTCGCLSAFRNAFDALIAVSALCSLLFILEIILFMKCGVAIAG